MSKFMRVFFVLALALAFALPVYAETQNVKVSGSLDAYWFYRGDYDLTNTHNVSTSNFFMSQTQVEVAADLTDNVSTVINLGNERNWDGAPTTVAANGNQYDVFVDLAYVQMKEIFYSPLTLTIGRQDLWWGRGFVLGNNSTAWDQQGSITANEYSIQTAFDAIRATLDFNPWTIDAIYSKINENTVTMEDEHDLYGVNIGYKFAEYNAVVEGYLLVDHDRANTTVMTGRRANDTETLGGRVQFDPISQMTLGGETAYQWGSYEDPTAGTAAGVAAGNPNYNSNKMKREAWALDLYATYRFDLTWKPDLTVEYVYFSGQKSANDLSNSKWTSWNSLYRGRFYTAYEDFREWQYGTAQAGDTNATQNSEMIQVKANMKPLDDLLITGSFSYFWSPEKDYTVTGAFPGPYSIAEQSNDIGYEWDLQVTYDYTEDVSFGLLTAWFIPGDKFTAPNDKTATDLVASAKVTF